ncbi:helix-turn-helix domain-containing protein, partial [Prescottella equi]|uniref:helix-turn-helix domain-containing protein n=2 Tax=Rhodococcus hoagii TaxID=43767 RepID=UPI0019802D54
MNVNDVIRSMDVLLVLAWVCHMCHSDPMTVQVGEDGAVFPVWSYGDKLRKARLTIGMDQRGFAEALGVSAGSLAQWETDRTKPRDVVAIAKRVELLTRIPAGWILGVQETPAGPNGPDGGRAVPPVGLEPTTCGLKV